MSRIDGDGPDAELLVQLRRHWGFEPTEKIVVIGTVRSSTLSDGKTLHFLEDLRHPVSFASLTYPGGANKGSTSAYVGPVLPNGFGIETEQLPWAIGELILSPLKEREKRENPYLCSVARGTLRPLREAPKDWIFMVRGPSSMALLEAAARDAILEKATQSTARTIAALEANVEAETAKLESTSTALARVLSRQTDADESLTETRRQLRDALRDLQTQREAHAKERALMEARLNSL